MKKIIYLDVDGTILNEHGLLSDYTKDVLIKVQQKNIGVVLNTGRNYPEIEQIAKDLKLKDFLNLAICENGAYTTYTDRLEPIILETINENDAKKIFNDLTAQKRYLNFSSWKDVEYVHSNHDDESVNLNANLKQVLPESKINKLIDENFDWNSITMGIFYAETCEVEDFKKYLNDNFENITYVVSEASSTFKPLFMLSAKNVDKATGMLKLNEKLKISNDDTYFFGDGFNDVPALKMFKNSFVPNNALDYVKKEVQDHQIIESNTIDGVAKKIAELFLND